MIAAGSQHRDGAHHLQFVAAGDTGQLPRQAEHLQERLHGLKKPGGEPSQAVHQVYQQAERREAYEEVGEEERHKAEPIFKLLELFSNVVRMCFGMQPETEYQDALKSFS